MTEKYDHNLGINGLQFAETLKNEFRKRSRPAKWFTSRIADELPENQARFFASLSLMNYAAEKRKGDGGMQKREDVIREIFLNTKFVQWSPRSDFSDYKDVQSQHAYIYYIIRWEFLSPLLKILHEISPPVFEGEAGRRSFFLVLKWALSLGRPHHLQGLLLHQPVDSLLSVEETEQLLNVDSLYKKSNEECKRILLERVSLAQLCQLYENHNGSNAIIAPLTWNAVITKNIEGKTAKTWEHMTSEWQQISNFIKHPHGFLVSVMKSESLSDDWKESLLLHLEYESVATFKESQHAQRISLFGQRIDWSHIEAVAFHAKALKNVQSKDMFHDLETIGKGAFGRVVKTRLVQYGSGLFSWLRGASQIPELDLAMKILRTDFENAEKEVDLLKTFQHPNIVRYFQSFSVSKDYFEDFYIIMEFCDSDLQKELEKKQNKIMSPKDVMELASQMSKATKYLEHKRVIHRDIKPANILVKWKPRLESEARWPQYKLADFGCLKNLNDSKRRMASLQTMSRVGTTDYMAPEVLMGERQFRKDPELRKKYLIRCSAMVDSWSFGIVFLHCLTGDIPHLGDIKEKVATVEDKTLRVLLEALLNEDPLDRKYLHEVFPDVVKDGVASVATAESGLGAMSLN